MKEYANITSVKNKNRKKKYVNELRDQKNARLILSRMSTFLEKKEVISIYIAKKFQTVSPHPNPRPIVPQFFY